jgi:hypothetical protein
MKNFRLKLILTACCLFGGTLCSGSNPEAYHNGLQEARSVAKIGAVISVFDGLKYAVGFPDAGSSSSNIVKVTPKRKITSVE